MARRSRRGIGEGTDHSALRSGSCTAHAWMSKYIAGTVIRMPDMYSRGRPDSSTAMAVRHRLYVSSDRRRSACSGSIDSMLFQKLRASCTAICVSDEQSTSVLRRSKYSVSIRGRGRS